MSNIESKKLVLVVGGFETRQVWGDLIVEIGKDINEDNINDVEQELLNLWDLVCINERDPIDFDPNEICEVRDVEEPATAAVRIDRDSEGKVVVERIEAGVCSRNGEVHP